MLSSHDFAIIANQFSEADSATPILIHRKVRLLWANSTLLTMFGYTLDELLNHTLLELSTEDTRTVLLQNTMMKYEQSYEIIAQTKGGIRFMAEVDSHLVIHHDETVQVMRLYQVKPPTVIKKDWQKSNVSVGQTTTELRFNNEQLRLELYERERMEAELKAQALQQAKVAELGQQALAGQELTDLMQAAVSMVAETLEVEYVKLLELLPTDEILILRAGVGWPTELIGQETTLSYFNSQSGYTLKQNESIIVENLAHEKRFTPSELLHAQEIVSGMSVIVAGHDYPFGVLAAHSTKPRIFGQDSIHFLQAIANVLATAIERKKSETELVQRNHELLILQSVGSIIMSSLNIKKVLQAVTSEMANLVKAEACYIYDWHQAENDISLLARHTPKSKLNKPLLDNIYNLADFPLTKQVLTTHHPIQHSLNPAVMTPIQRVRLGPHNFQTSLMLAMIFQERVIGLIEILTDQVERVFTPAEIALAQLLANQAAGAIDNARLYDEMNQYLEELTTLNLITQMVTSSLNLEETLTTITQHVIHLAGVTASSIALYDEIKGDIWFAATSGGGEEFIKGRRLPLGQGVVGWVIQHDEAVLVQDVSNDSRFFQQFDQQSGFTTHSIMCVPLQTKGQTIGAIEALNKEGTVFSPDDLRILISLAAPAATAIENARLYQTLAEERASLAQRVAERTTDLQTANEELARSAKLKDEFLANMSHELRTPLTAILGLCEVLKLEVYGDLNERQIKSVSNIDESGRHLLALINDILDLSKIEAGKLEMHIHPVSVNAVCQTSLQFIKQIANKKQLNLTVKLDDANPILQADERRLKQILVNLLSNAVKFTPDNGHVGLKVVSSVSQNMIYITVWDSGIGISPEDMKRLFKPFVQLDNSLSRQHTGTGLGLVLVSRMVELHLGKITVESDVGLGSRFTISLPWQPQLAMLPSSSEAEIEPLLVIQRVLVVEDSMMMVNQLTRYLNSLNVTNVVHVEGEQAVAKAQDFQPNVIILDLMLNYISGWEILTSLKNNILTQHIPVLVVSVLDEQPRGLALGAAEYLVKPITQQQLLGALYRAIINKPIIDEHVLTTIEPPIVSAMPIETTMPLILVTEDDENIANLFNDFLWVKGYRIIIARNGKEALKQVALETPDLILMDIQMPEMDGLEAMKKLRAQPQFAFTPIIALTARAMAGDREQCLAAGANDYLSKPVQLQQLAQVIESYLKP